MKDKQGGTFRRRGGTDELLMELGARIKGARNAAGLSQRETASKVGITQSNLYLIEAGGQNTSYLVLRGLAEAFGVSMGRLLPEKDVGVSASALIGLMEELRAALALLKSHVEEDNDLMGRIGRLSDALRQRVDTQSGSGPGIEN